MTEMKMLSAVVILSAAVATPVFAQDAGNGLEPRPGSPYHGRGYYSPPAFYSAPAFFAPYAGYGYFGGRDRSRVGGIAPSLRPSGS